MVFHQQCILYKKKSEKLGNYCKKWIEIRKKIYHILTNPFELQIKMREQTLIDARIQTDL